MEFIFDLTCPATIQTPEYNGHVAVHRSVQWIDPDTITQCELLFVNGPKEAINPTRLRDLEVFRLGGGEVDIGDGMLACAFGQGVGPLVSIHG